MSIVDLGYADDYLLAQQPRLRAGGRAPRPVIGRISMNWAVVSARTAGSGAATRW
ncbi:MAG: hypothetical protein U1F77_10055 [Kiritimatiellia bacterium]